MSTKPQFTEADLNDLREHVEAVQAFFVKHCDASGKCAIEPIDPDQLEFVLEDIDDALAKRLYGVPDKAKL